MNRIGKKTPVWRNTNDGRILCGQSVQEALGTGWSYDVGPQWEHVTSLPSSDRVVIQNGSQISNKDVARQIASIATKTGPVTIVFMGRSVTVLVVYEDGTKVIIETQQCKEDGHCGR